MTDDRERECHGLALGVADNVIERFFEREENSVAQPGIERVFGELFGDFEAAGDSGQVQKALGEQGVIAGQRGDRIVLRIDGPDDFVQAGDQGASGLGQLVQVTLAFVGVFRHHDHGRSKRHYE